MKPFSKEHKDKLKENHKGMLGKKHTIETKAKLSECMKGRIRNEETKLKISESNKGKQFTNEHKDKLSKSHIGKKRLPHTKETKEKISNSLKGRHLSSDHIKKLRILKIIDIEKNKLNGNQLYPNFNPNACKIIDEYGKNNGYNFQHAMNGGEFYIKELGYWVDGHDKDKNVVIEIDEKKHFDRNGNFKEKDVIRQKEIQSHLNCEFIRIKI